MLQTFALDPAQIERNIEWIDLCKQSLVIAHLLFQSTLQEVQLPRCPRLHKLKNVFLYPTVLETFNQLEILSINQESHFNEMDNPVDCAL